jgi:putative ABC transport system ATP-binding protein
MISARGLVKRYPDGEGGSLVVLDQVNLDVEAREFLAIVGASGSGKSTLLHLLAGLDVHYEGELSVLGQRLTGLPDLRLSEHRNQKVGFVFQSFHLVPRLSVEENVALPSHFQRGLGPTGEAALRCARERLARVGLAAKARRLPAQLSGGERQRVAIARALFFEPPLLLCDEPTGNLDEATGAEIIALFSSLHAEGRTVVAVTHEERLRRAAGRVLRLSQGKLTPDVGALA